MLPKPSTCQGCPLFGDGTGFVPDNIPPDAHVVFIGQNPGEVEEFQGKPFVGPTGQMLQHDFVARHMPELRIGYANVLKCRATGPAGRHTNKLPAVGRADWLAAVAHCRGFLDESFQRAPHALHVWTGDSAIRAGTGLGGPVLHTRGSFRKDLWGADAYTVEHPAALLPNRTPELRDVMHMDMRRVARLAGGWRPEEYRDDFTIADAELLRRWLDSNPSRLALDLETQSHGSVDMVGFAKSAQEAVLLRLPDPEGLAVLKEALTGREVIVHYGEGLELAWLLDLLGSEWLARTTVHDLGKLFHAYDPEYATAGRSPGLGGKPSKRGGGSGALAFIQSLYTWRPYHKHLLKEAERAQDVAKKARYCMLDCVATWEAFHRLEERIRIERPRAYEAYLRDGVTVPPIMVRMTQAGMAVDKERFNARKQALRVDLQAQAAAVLAHYGDGVAPKAKKAKYPIGMQALKKALLAEGVKLPKKKRPNGTFTETLDREARKKLMSVHPEMALLEAYFGTQDTLSDFYKTGIISRDGRCHPHCSGFLATWRWRYSDPNIAQWPERERQVFVADPGHVFAQFDTSAGEYRWFAGESGDPLLARLFAEYDRTGEAAAHPHVCNAALLFDVAPLEAATWKADGPLHARYTFAKNFIYWLIYCWQGGEDSLRGPAAKAGLPFGKKLMVDLKARWLAQYPIAAKHREALVRTGLAAREAVCKEWGYLRKFHGRDPANEMVNFSKQAGIAGLINRTVREMWERYRLVPWKQMHDGMTYQLPAPDAASWQLLARDIHASLTQPCHTLGGMQIPVDVAVGTRDGELEKWKP